MEIKPGFTFRYKASDLGEVILDVNHEGTDSDGDYYEVSIKTQNPKHPAWFGKVRADYLLKILHLRNASLVW